MMARRWLWIGLLTALPLVSGCPMSRWLAYVALGGKDKKVQAEFAELSGKSVVVVVYVDKGVQYEYPNVCLTVSATVAEELRKNVEPSEVIDPRRVVKYQDANIYWDEMDKTALGKHFGADYVLLLALVEFNTREPGSMNLYRGRITAEPSVYKVSLPERQARVWRGETIRVVYPEHDPAGQLRENDRAIRVKTEHLFADRLVKKFYDHKVPIE